MEQIFIFRTQGDRKLINQLISNIETSSRTTIPQLFSEANIYVLCSILKQFLRALPEPLIPYSKVNYIVALLIQFLGGGLASCYRTSY